MPVINPAMRAGRRTPERVVQKIRELRDQQWSTNKIAITLGVSRGTVLNYGGRTPGRAYNRSETADRDDPDVAQRKCLCCGNFFLSSWKGNRRCGACDTYLRRSGLDNE